MTMRAIGAFNGLLPEPTGVLTAYLRDPSMFPYLQYTQMIPAPEFQFMYFRMNFDEPVRVPRENDYVWAYGDYRPSGKGFAIQGDWVDDRCNRWDFPYTIDENTIRVWQKAGFSLKNIYDQTRGQQFQVHRAWRAVKKLVNASWPPNNTSTLAALLGDTVYFDQSLGTATTPAGNIDPRFQVIKRALNKIKRIINLSTNGAVRRDQLFAVIPPVVAEAISNTDEIREALKQSQYAKEVTDLKPGNSNVRDWNIPESYAGFTFVVEDTPRVKINQHADGTMADVTVASQKDYILDTDSVYFTSRSGALDGVYGNKSFSTLQMYHFRGEGRVEAFSEPKHEMVEGHIVAEDKFVTPSLVSGYALTDVLST